MPLLHDAVRGSAEWKRLQQRLNEQSQPVPFLKAPEAAQRGDMAVMLELWQRSELCNAGGRVCLLGKASEVGVSPAQPPSECAANLHAISPVWMLTGSGFWDQGVPASAQQLLATCPKELCNGPEGLPTLDGAAVALHGAALAWSRSVPGSEPFAMYISDLGDPEFVDSVTDPEGVLCTRARPHDVCRPGQTLVSEPPQALQSLRALPSTLLAAPRVLRCPQ